MLLGGEGEGSRMQSPREGGGTKGGGAVPPRVLELRLECAKAKGAHSPVVELWRLPNIARGAV